MAITYSKYVGVSVLFNCPMFIMLDIDLFLLMLDTHLIIYIFYMLNKLVIDILD